MTTTTIEDGEVKGFCFVKDAREVRLPQNIV